MISSSGLKHAALRVGLRAGLFRFVQVTRRRQAVIVTFHRFSGNGEGDPRGLPVDKLAAYMEYLTRRYRVVSLPELTAELRQGTVRPNTAAVTVDDGYHETFSLAAPVFRRYGVRASFFVVSGFVDGRLWLWTDRLRFAFEHAPRRTVTFRHRGVPRALNMRDAERRWRLEERWCEYAKTLLEPEREQLLETIADAFGVEIPAAAPSEYRPMTWGELRELAAEGFDIGAHTRTHPILSRLDVERLPDEISESKAQIERHLGRGVTHFAYPNGRREDYTPEVVEAVARAGYLAAVTTIEDGNTPDAPIFELRRIGGEAEDVVHFAQCVSGFELLKERLRASLRS